MSRKLLKLGAIGASTLLAYKQLQTSYQPKFPQFLHLRAEELSAVQHSSHGTDQCILVIGTTGTGKSSTISKCTGQSVEVSDRADSVTRKCQIFADLNKSSQPVWIDTVGYDDTTRLDDEESFKSVLKFIQQENLLKIKAIIWTILPQERKDARLQVTGVVRTVTVETIIIVITETGGVHQPVQRGGDLEQRHHRRQAAGQLQSGEILSGGGRGGQGLEWRRWQDNTEAGLHLPG